MWLSAFVKGMCWQHILNIGYPSGLTQASVRPGKNLLSVRSGQSAGNALEELMQKIQLTCIGLDTRVLQSRAGFVAKTPSLAGQQYIVLYRLLLLMLCLPWCFLLDRYSSTNTERSLKGKPACCR